MMRPTLAFAFACCLAAAAHAETKRFHADLNAASEVPPKESDGTGKAEALLDGDSRTLTYAIQYSHLTGPVTAAHFHGPAAPGSNAGIAVPITGGLSNPIKGTATLTEQQASELKQGQWYVNLHTAANPGGEIRGQMLPGK